MLCYTSVRSANGPFAERKRRRTLFHFSIRKSAAPLNKQNHSHPWALRYTTAPLRPSPLQRPTVLRECTCGTILADGCHAHDDPRALLDGLASPAGGSEVSSGKAGLDRIELDLWQRLGVLETLRN